MTDQTSANPAPEQPSAPETQDAGSSQPSTIGDSIDKAFAAVDAEYASLEDLANGTAPDRSEKGEQTEQKPTKEEENTKSASDGPERDEAGRFKSKNADAADPEKAGKAETDKAAEKQAEKTDDDTKKDKPASSDRFDEPPARFSDDAKAAWKDAPLPVRAEMQRTIREIESGMEKYRQAATDHAELDQLRDYTAKQGTNIRDALTKYINFENFIRQDPMRGVEMILQRFNVTPQQYASQILDQPQDAAQQGQERVIMELRNQVAALQQQIGGVTESMQSQAATTTQQQVDAFASAHPRFDELSADIERLISTGFADTLEQAYEYAERLKPAPAAPPVQEPAPTEPARAQTEAANRSISGAPASGSYPTARKPSKSARQAVDAAFEQLGL